MRYRVYSRIRGTRTIAPSERDGRPFAEFAASADAAAWAEALRRCGRVAMVTIDDDGPQVASGRITRSLKSTG